MKYQLRVNKFGSNSFGKWVLGQVTNGIVCINGIFHVDCDIELSEGLIVNVKSLIISYNNKTNKYSYKISL